jgi:hypothetical protein
MEPIEPSEENPSLMSIMLLALVINIVIFVVFITVTRRYRTKPKKPAKYKKVTASTKKPVAPKSRAKPAFERMVQNEMERQPDATSVNELLMASPKAADARDEYNRFMDQSLQSNQSSGTTEHSKKVDYSDMVPRKEKEIPKDEEAVERKPFEISEQPIQKIETAYYKNILQTTMGNAGSETPNVSNLKPAYDELIDQIEQLLAYNFDVKTIAKELGLGQDEVRMMINLRRSRGQVADSQNDDNSTESSNRITFA